MNKLLRLSPYLLAITSWLGIIAGGLYTLTALVIFFCIHPAIDQLIKNKLSSNDGRDHPLYLEVLLLTYPLFQTVFLIHTFTIFLSEQSIWINIVQILSIGITCAGIGITAAHELIHRKDNIRKALGIYVLALQNYTWFRIEHVFGHHKYVATKLDPATSKLNQNLYPFVIKSIYGGIKNSFNFEKKRLEKRKYKYLKNRMYQYTIISILYFSLASIFFGLKGFYFVLGISLVGTILTEIVNYIEHYGLERKMLSSGHFEPVREIHSWDSNFAVTNLSLFNLGKHSHHHAKFYDQYQKLTNQKGNPVLPMGYTAAILLASIPPLWKNVMNPLAIARKEIK
jgi:alkane 1-monooxygenase